MSSFAYLKYLPVDFLKIAGVFIKDMVNDPMDYAIVDSINRISHILGMQTVAESVEDGATMARITELGLDYAQGYFVAEPEALGEEPAQRQTALPSSEKRARRANAPGGRSDRLSPRRHRLLPRPPWRP
jgi:EAL domain-containing protein (putative c-di-GMP-specific phosphodiesterase class I)